MASSIIDEYLSKVQEIYKTGEATEHSYRSALELLFTQLDRDIIAINEAKAVKVGRPDFVINRGEITVGWCEAKDIGLDITPKSMKDPNKGQFERYSKAFPNLIYTNCLDFRFYKNGELVREISIADFLMGIQPKTDQFEVLENQLKDFIAERLQTISSSRKLAEMMAAKAILIKDILHNSLKEDDAEETELYTQYRAFKEQLIHDLSVEEFSDIYAETIAYGMFAARLHDDTLEDFSRQEALELLPKSNPFLKNLFSYIAGPTLDHRIKRTIDELADIFQATDLGALFRDFGKFTQRNDPFIHFYETFLSEYNPKKRKARGVWYTPEAVVNFIVRAVDEVLQTEFGLPMGLADTSKVTIDFDTGQRAMTKDGKRFLKSGKNIIEKKEVHRVQILDPATGTGTFLAEVIKQVAPKVKNIAAGAWNSYVENDLVPRIHGFELLMASYAMCHMKLDMVLTELGYVPTSSAKRLSVFLTNSLEEGEPVNQTLPFAQWLSNEVKQANTIKRDMPIMCIIGNPPYSVSSSNKSDWIEGLMADYKKDLNERNIQPLSDDYIKFIRFSQHYIEKNGEGILGFITNNSYLDGLIHRQFRKSLLEAFDKIYILDLHGSAKKREISPDGTSDKNVFDIQQGVAIIIAVKKAGNSKENAAIADVYFVDLWGSRLSKQEYLFVKGLSIFSNQATNPSPDDFTFKPKTGDPESTYYDGFQVTELFLKNNSGFVSARDQVLVGFDKKDVEKVLDDFSALEENEFRKRYNNLKDSRDWTYSGARKDAKNATVIDTVYRPLDIRFIPFTSSSKGILSYPRYEIMHHMISGENVGLCFNRQIEVQRPFFDVYAISTVFDKHGLSSKENNSIAPLYLYPQEDELDQTRRVNFDEKIWKKIIKLAKDENRGEPDELAIFDYIYGVLHNPNYREAYKEFLKVDFPRIPYPMSSDMFWDISEKGARLRRLHLMEGAIIGETPYPFSGVGDNKVDKTNFVMLPEEENGKVYINTEQYFENIPQISWDFYIGGYQPAQKWLRDRKGRELSFEDIMHYQKIIKILSETDQIMKTIEFPIEVSNEGK
ncbi:MAG: type ISP restriction/modification enzyme [Methyloligellaceae bacterium]